MFQLRHFLTCLAIVSALACAPGLGLAATPSTPPFSQRVAQGRQALERGAFAQAESLGRTLLAEAEARRRPNVGETADALDIVCEAMGRGSKVRSPELLPLARRAVALRRARRDLWRIERDPGLGNLARALTAASRDDSARVVLEESLELRRRSLGPNHPKVASAIVSISQVDYREGKLPAYRQRVEEAVAVSSRAPAPVDSLPVSKVYQALGQSQLVFEEYEKAAASFEFVLGLETRLRGPDHPELAPILNNLGAACMRTGDFARSRACLERSVVLQERNHGPDHPGLATTLENLSWVLGTLGDHAGARRTAQRALAIREKVHGPDDRRVAVPLRRLLEAAQNLGDYESALAFGQRALAISRRIPGRDSTDLARSLDQIGTLLLDMERPREARPYLAESLGLWERGKGPAYINSVWMRGQVARTFAMEGNHAEAARRYAEVVRLQEGGPVYYLAQSLGHLADTHYQLGHLDTTRALLARAHAIRDSVLGPDSYRTLQTLSEMARVDYDLGRREEAFRAALRVEEGSREALRRTANALSEREALGFAQVRENGLHLLLTMAADSVGLAEVDRGATWDALVRSRAVVLDDLADRRRSLRSGSPEVARLVAGLDSARADLARRLVEESEDSDPAEARARIAAARFRREEAERELGEHSAAFRSDRERARLGLAEVAAALPMGSRLVGYARYRRHRGAAVTGGAAREEYAYLAFILPRPGAAAEVVPLGPAAPLERLIRDWRRLASLPPGRARGQERAAEARCARAGEMVRRRVWDPVAGRLGSVERVFVVPDGDLPLVNLSTLPAGAGLYLVERGPVTHVLTTERDLVPTGRGSTPGLGLLAVGAPDFDRGSEDAAPAAPPMQTALAAGVYRSAIPDSGRTRFTPLPGAGREADRVAAAWRTARPQAAATEPAIILTGERATEAAFKRLAPGKRVLHVATHGFALGGAAAGTPRPGSGAAATRGVAGLIAHSERENAPQFEAILPAVACLAFAGANRGGSTAGGGEDGVLTGEEVLSLDLNGVEWVVLSACESGVADRRAAESVQGLHRAFRIAGVPAVVVSLWGVDDEAACEWMEALYRARLQGGRSTADSARDACRATLAARRARGASTHPFYWGAFIAAGDWR